MVWLTTKAISYLFNFMSGKSHRFILGEQAVCTLSFYCCSELDMTLPGNEGKIQCDPYNINVGMCLFWIHSVFWGSYLLNLQSTFQEQGPFLSCPFLIFFLLWQWYSSCIFPSPFMQRIWQAFNIWVHFFQIHKCFVQKQGVILNLF